MRHALSFQSCWQKYFEAFAVPKLDPPRFHEAAIFSATGNDNSNGVMIAVYIRRRIVVRIIIRYHNGMYTTIVVYLLNIPSKI